jgi:hypothetical protein
MAWYDFLGSVTIRINSTDTTIPGASVRIVPIPYLGGGDSVREDIAGTRYSRFSDPKWHFDIECVWRNVKKSDWTTARTLINSLASNATQTFINFCPVAPYDATKIINVVPVFEEGMYPLQWDEKVRNRPLILKFRSRTTVTTIPAWMAT